MFLHEGIWEEEEGGRLEVKLRIILKLGTVGRQLVSSTHLPLSTQRNSFRSPLNGRLGGPQSRSVRFVVLSPPRIKLRSIISVIFGY